MKQYRGCRMDPDNWNAIKAIAIQDPIRMEAYNALAELNERMSEETYIQTFSDLRRWEELREQLLKREWEILDEYNAARIGV